jgi:hypothetical protein
MHAIYPAHLVLHDFITLLVLGKKHSYEVPNNADFLKPLPFHPSSVQMFSSMPHSQILPVYVLLFMSETTFHIHTKTQSF